MKERIDRLYKKAEGEPLILGIAGLFFLAAFLAPVLYLGKGCVFEVHDQMDETLLSYVLTAQNLFRDTIPQILGGIPAEGLKPSAVLFLPLYLLLSPFDAFVLQYVIVLFTAFYGMYFLIGKLTGNYPAAFAGAVLFASLPFLHVYGLTVMGIPLLLLCFLQLGESAPAENLPVSKRHRWIKTAAAYLGIVFFALTTHLVLIGYVVIFFLGLYWLYLLLTRKIRLLSPVTYGLVLLGIVYVISNYGLFFQLVIGGSDYVCHREEFVNYGTGFWEAFREGITTGIMHAKTYASHLFLPVAAGGVCAGIPVFCARNKAQENGKEDGQNLGKQSGSEKYLGKAMLLCGAVIISASLLYAFFSTQSMADWKNTKTGLLRYTEFNRFVWCLPAVCFLFFGLSLAAIYRLVQKWNRYAALLCIMVIALLVWRPILMEGIFYRNVNQINNGSGTTGYLTWESLYAENLCSEIESAIGRDKKDYKVASLGMSPVVALMNGFYTVDGYSNNYSLDYKHAFRKVIAGELAKNEVVRLYFDEWGSRCYLFNGQTGIGYWLGSNTDFRYTELDFDMEALKELGCEYLFSAAEIACSEDLGLLPMGCFEDDISYWKIWLYRVQ